MISETFPRKEDVPRVYHEEQLHLAGNQLSVGISELLTGRERPAFETD